MEDVYKSSFYLIDEQAHPMIYQIDLETPEELPEDFSGGEFARLDQLDRAVLL